jgi:hypothetical protein
VGIFPSEHGSPSVRRRTKFFWHTGQRGDPPVPKFIGSALLVVPYSFE